jgi:hypothetical protein
MKKTINDYIKEIINRGGELKDKDFDSQLKWRSVSALSKRLGISKEQALVFAYSFFKTLTSKAFSAQDLRLEMSSEPFDLPKVLRNLTTLYAAKLVLKSDSYSGEEYSVSKNVVLLIDDNNPPNVENVGAKKDILELSDEIFQLVTMRYETMITHDEFYNEMTQILDLQGDYKVFSYLRKQGVSQNEWLIFLVTFVAHLSGEDYACTKKMVKNMYSGSRNQFEYRTKLQKEETQLQQKKLIEFAGDEFKNKEQICIPDSVLKEILEDHYPFVIEKKQSELNATDLIQPTDIITRELFYNNGEVSEINTLKDLLHPEKFASIQENMKEAGYKSGFCVLLHGTPGTGKTETVMQLAKQTGRLVLKVDIATIRDKFVGETEKNISEIFARYKRLCKQTELTPILLFNEADALFNKRVTVRQSVDQMNNSMQNILLEALENFEGILFATTNLAPNMDTAFERRFLYKIKFLNPSDQARRSIWQEHFPELDTEILEEIASSFTISGGQIENVVRKAKLQTILYKHSISMDLLRKLCTEESISNKSTMNQIGFKRD